jgi:biotin operon repressor
LRLKEAGYDVFSVGNSRSRVYKSKHGYEMPQELAITEAAAKVLMP